MALSFFSWSAAGVRAEADNSTAHPLFTPGCTLVLFSGLAGDLETENSYREQMQGWIDLAVRSGIVGRVYVLCEQPETVQLPKKSEFTASKGDRKEFLALGQRLKSENGLVVVIAWGHGGQQRTTPVLHVRGPRLTPEDFASVADALEARESRWILLFRSSGAFARKLEKEQREIISSDFELAFTSDPIGMPLLLKLVSDERPQSFEQLSAAFGRATAAWYQQRHLARTEEPTLWKAGEVARKLAGSSEAAAAGAESAGDLSNDPDTSKRNKIQATEDNTQAAQTEPSGAWKELKKAIAGQHPDADGVILSQTLRCTLGTSPALAIEQEKFIQILTPEGKQFGDFDVSFSPPQEELEFLDCEVMSPEGKIARLNPDAIREAREQELGEYQRERRKYFSLPGVVPGAVLHVRFKTQWKEFPLPKISLPLPVGDELPAVRASIQVSVPKDASFHFAFQNLSAPDPEVKTTGYGTSYSWELRNVPAHRQEVLSKPGQAPQLLVSTFADWRAFADWYGRISRLTDEVTPEIEAKAKELTAKAKSDREKVQELYNYVVALRYVAVPLGINSVRPHAAANVLQNQYGDCKDKANLLNTLLRAVNIEANLVLVPRFSQAFEAVPGLAFNHAISRVKLGGEALWLDTTDDVCRFGMLPPGDPGRNVLPIGPETASLAQLPIPKPDEHRLTVSGEIAWSENAEGMPAELKAAAIGYPDYELRTTARDAREHRASLPLLAVRFRPLAGVFALARQTATPVSSLQDDFAWRAEGTYVGLGSRSGTTGELRPPFWIPREWDQALHRRHTPLFLNQGYPLTLDQSFDFTLPRGSKAAALPGICENSQAPLHWRVEWATIGDDKIRARFYAQLQRGELSEGETVLLQEQLRTLLSELGTGANFRIP